MKETDISDGSDRVLASSDYSDSEDMLSKELNLYDSVVDDVDEIWTLQQTLFLINKTDRPRFDRMMSEVVQLKEQSSLDRIIKGIDLLMEQEAQAAAQLKRLK